MRIVHVSDCYLPRLGGIETQLGDLVARQREAGHQVRIITSTRAAGSASEGGEVVRVDRSPQDPGRIGYRRSALVRGVLGQGKDDVIHLHTSGFSPLSYLAVHHAVRHRIPAVLTVHSLWDGATPLFRLAERLSGWADWPVEWSAVSQAAAAPVRRVLAGRAEVTVVPNGVDPVPWQVDPIPGRRHELRLVAVGRLAPRKRTMHLARLLRDAHRRLPPDRHLSVEIIGDGPERRPLQRYLAAHGMDGWVHLRGSIDRTAIARIFARSDVFVSPAVLESFGIAALEARCAGLPVLARCGTGIAEFIAHGTEGWLVDSDGAMADLIVALAADSDPLRQVATHNRSVPAGITWHMVLDRYDQLYRRAAARRGTLEAVSAQAVPVHQP